MGKFERMRALNRAYARLPMSVKDGEWKLSRAFVCGEGRLDAKIMLIGQAPGANEDVKGRPFVSISSRFLDRLLLSAGIERSEAYITSAVQFFPPKNRAPSKSEINMCRRYLEMQIDIIKPKLIVLLGSIALNAVLGIGPIMEFHGVMLQSDGASYYPTLHPAAAIRIRRNMPLIEGDFEMLGSAKDIVP